MNWANFGKCHVEIPPLGRQQSSFKHKVINSYCEMENNLKFVFEIHAAK